MIAFLYSLSDLSVAMLFGSVVAFVFIAAPLVRARLFGSLSAANAEIAHTSMTAITGFTGAVLAFSLVQAQGNLRSVERTVATEAMQLSQVDRLLVSYGDATVGPIREAMRAYAQSVVVDEWPKLSQHGASEPTAELFHAVSRQIMMIRPMSARETVIYGDLVKSLDQLTESRLERLTATDLGLPPIYWEVIVSLMALLVAFSAFAEPQRALALGGLGAGLALLITLVFIFDQPFLGNVSVTPAAFVDVLQAMGTARLS
jgi:hypothetical protein